MDHQIIYAKTAAGERAMLERTRAMARNVRMVLILVDSQSSVGDLCLKTGNSQLTESALHELEKGGFIEPRQAPDSQWGDDKKLGQQIRAAASRGREASVSVPPAEVSALVSSMPASVQPAVTGVPSVRPAAVFGDESPPSIVSRVKEIFPQQHPVAGRASGAARSSRDERRMRAAILRRRPHAALGWPARLALALIAAIAVVVLAVLYFPYARYLPEVETAMARACGRPVRVATLEVVLHPQPQILLRDVRIGDEGAVLRVDELRLAPRLASLWATHRVFDSVVASGIVLSTETIAALPQIFAHLTRPGVPLAIKRLSVEQASVSIAGLEVSGLAGEVERSADGRWGVLALSSAERNLTFNATMHAESLAIAVEAVGWRPHEASPLRFDSASLDGVVARGVFTIRHFELRAFDGLIEGSATRDARKVSGEASLQRVDLARLEEAFGFAQQFGGELAGRFGFSANGESWEEIVPSLEADGEFTVRRGNVRGLDLIEAARSAAHNAVQGGETRFESLSGKIRIRPDEVRLSELLLTSGLMQSAGGVAIGGAHRLSGRLELRMRGTAAQTRVPLQIGGTLTEPTVQAVGGD